MLNPEVFEAMSDEEKMELAEIYADPVLFATIILDEEPRWYQKKMIRDKSLKKVYRTGRRVGKCIHKDTVVFNPNTGELNTVENIYLELKSIRKYNPLWVSSIDEDNNIVNEMASIFDNGVQECFEIITKSGKTVKLTGNHPLLTKLKNEESWIETDDIKNGMLIAVPHNLPFFGSNVMDDYKIKLLAYMISNGSTYSNQISFSTKNKKIQDDFQKQISYFNECSIEKNQNELVINDKNNSLRRFLENHNIMWKCNSVKSIPKQIFMLKKDNIKTFLHTLLACESTYLNRSLINVRGKKVKKNEIIYHSVSKHLIKDIQHLLLRFGIFSSIKETRKNIWSLSISGVYNLGLFIKEIGIFDYSKELKKCNYTIPEKIENIYWDEVVSKSSIGEHQTYDLSVPETGNFVANDIFVHNTWSMVMEAIHFAVTNPNKKVLMSAPYDSQVTSFFKEVRRLIYKSPFVSSMVVRDVKSPNNIVFSNGSDILGHTSGTRSGASGDSMRGLDAHMVILDEVDRMTRDDINSIMPIIYTDPLNRYLRTASTPTGKRSFFYEWCHDKENWSEHHYPSSINPEWQKVDPETGKTVEEMLRGELTEQAWIFEVIADFGQETAGVFNKDFIDRAKKKYKYYSTTEKPDNNNLRVIGVDWDKMGDTGTTICVLEWNSDKQRFRIVYREEVTKGEYTYDNAVKRIITLNDIFDPEFIYADSGSGNFCRLVKKFTGY